MISFDVFDTIITRKVYSAEGIFLLMQEKIRKLYPVWYTEKFGNDFVKIRKDAEQIAREVWGNSMRDEVTLQEIYCAMKKMNGLPDVVINEIMKLEEETEIENVEAISDNITKLKKYLEKGEKVILISDMYLSKETIRSMLEKVDLLLGTLTLYVSSEIGCTKMSGSLFAYVANKEGIRYSEWIHIGDNWKADIEGASLWGIQTVYVKQDEKVLETRNRFGVNLNLEEQIFLGTIKNVMNDHIKLNSNQFIGAFWGGGFLFSYVAWVISMSLNRGFKRLYFIARDGYVLKIIADAILKEFGYDIKTYYIYGSRLAWREEDPQKKHMVKRYLEQEVKLSDGSFAFVDLQGSGKSILQIKQYLVTEQEPSLNVFFYQITPGLQGNEYSMYIYQQLVKEDVLEVFARAPHGVTTGYMEQDGRMVPILEQIPIEVWENAGLFEYYSGLSLFAQKYSEVLAGCGEKGIGRGIAQTLCKLYLEKLNDTEKRFVSHMPHCSSFEDAQLIYAPSITRNDLFMVYMWRTIEPVEVYYSGNLSFALRMMNKKDKDFCQWMERNYYKLIGNLIHGIKHLFNRKINVGRKRFVIYGAGKRGREVYTLIKYMTNGRVIGWSDSKYIQYKKMGYPVKELESCLNSKYDILLIGLEKDKYCEEVKQYLVYKGVISEKIVFYSNFIKSLRE